MKAFTLVEVLISVLILSMVVVAMFTVLNTGNVTYYADMGYLDLQHQVRAAMDGMIREIRQSRSKDVSVSGGGTTVEFKVPVDVLVYPAVYSDTVKYYLNDSNQIIREHPTGITKILANNIDSLNFCCQDNAVCGTDCLHSRLFEVTLEAKNMIKQKVLSIYAKEKVNFRNADK
ncbi:MAG: PilW family protein [Deltaproteobacteria bacterium]